MKSRILATVLAVLTAVTARDSPTEQTVKRYESNPHVIMNIRQNPFLAISQLPNHVQEGIDSPQIITPAASDSYIWQLEGVYEAVFSGPHSFSIGDTQKAIISFGFAPGPPPDTKFSPASHMPLSDTPLTFELVQGIQYPVKIAYASGAEPVPIVVSVDGETHDLSEVIRRLDEDIPEAASKKPESNPELVLIEVERSEKEQAELDKQLAEQTAAEELAKNLTVQIPGTDADKEKLEEFASGASGASSSNTEGDHKTDGNEQPKEPESRTGNGDGNAEPEKNESSSAAGGSSSEKDKTGPENNEPPAGGSQEDGKPAPESIEGSPLTTPDVAAKQNEAGPSTGKKRDVDDDDIVMPIGFKEVHKLSPEAGFEYAVFPAARVTDLDLALRNPTILPILEKGVLNKEFTRFVPSSDSAALAQECTGFFTVPTDGLYMISLTDEPTTVFHFGPGSEKKATNYVMDKTWTGVDTREDPEGEFELKSGVFYPYRLMMLLPSPDSKREVIVHGPEGELLDILGLWEKAPTPKENQEQNKQNPLVVPENTLQKEPEIGGQQQNDDMILKGDASMAHDASGDSNTIPSQNGRDQNLSIEGVPEQDELLKGDAAFDSSTQGANGQKQVSETTSVNTEGVKNVTLPLSLSSSHAKDITQRCPHMSTGAQKGSNSIEVAEPRSSLTRETSLGVNSTLGVIVSAQAYPDVMGAGTKGGASLRAQALQKSNNDMSAEMKFDVKYSFSACVPGIVCASPVSPNLIYTGKDVVQGSPKSQSLVPGSKNADSAPRKDGEPSTALKSGAKQPSVENTGSRANADVNASVNASVKVEAKLSVGSGFGGEAANKDSEAARALPSTEAGRKSLVDEEGKSHPADSKQASKPADSSKASEEYKPADATGPSQKEISPSSESTPAGKAQAQAQAKFIPTYEGGASRTMTGLSLVLSFILFAFV